MNSKMKYRERLQVSRAIVIILAFVCIPYLVYKAIRVVIEDSDFEEHESKSVVRYHLPPYLRGLSDITPEEFKELQSSTTRFVLCFYAPANKNNLNFLEDFNHLAESISSDIHIRNSRLTDASYRYDEIVFGTVNCEEYGELCNSNELKLYGYPTTIAFNFKYHNVISKSSLWQELKKDTLTSDIGEIKAYIKEHHFTHKVPSFFYDKSDVITELTDNELQEIVASDDHKQIVFVMFYVHWCPHCKGFVDRFNEIAHQFHVKREAALAAKRTELRTFSPKIDMLDRRVLFAAINCDLFRDTCFGHNLPIEHYPTIIAFNMNKGLDHMIEVVSRDKLELYLNDLYFENIGNENALEH